KLLPGNDIVACRMFSETDRDGNGMEDAWEAREIPQFTSGGSPLGTGPDSRLLDSDGDGSENWQEHALNSRVVSGTFLGVGGGLKGDLIGDAAWSTPEGQTTVTLHADDAPRRSVKWLLGDGALWFSLPSGSEEKIIGLDSMTTGRVDKLLSNLEVGIRVAA